MSKYEWFYCRNCRIVYSKVYKEDYGKCPYCGSRNIARVEPERIVYVEVGVREPRMVIQWITVDEDVDKLLERIPVELRAWVKKEKPRLEYKTVSRAYFFAYKNAISSREPRLWHLLEDIRRLGNEYRRSQ